MFRRPALTLEEFAKVPSGWRRGLTLMALMALAYTVVDVQLAFNGVAPIPDPFLRIPAGEYYKWAALFYGAAILAGWLLATGVMQLAARAAGGVGEFESLVAATGLATAVATLPTLIPDLITSTSGIYDTWATSGLSTALPWLYMALYVFLFLVYYPLAVAAVHDVSRGRAIVIGLTGYLLYQGFIFIFIR
ncbi:MAG: YIP1 family protein [Acidimicrobiia bacterium]|nr:YIP1 family protein [Acidimicrobiia bacterium]